MRRRAWTGARVVCAGLVLAARVARVGADPFLDGLRGLGPGSLLAATAIGGATTVCSAWRWQVVARGLGMDLPLPAAIAACYRSQFLNSTLPGGVLGDVHRGVRHGAAVLDLGRGVRGVVWERAAGQVVQAALALAVLLVAPSPVHAAMPTVVSGLALVAVLLLLTSRGLLRHGPARLVQGLRGAAADVRAALLQPAAWPPVVLASLLVVGTHVGMFLLAARAAGVDEPPRSLLPAALIVLLAAAIPLNVGGWGPREGVAAWVFAAAGWGAGAGTAVATAFGALVLAATLPGGLLLVAGGLRPRRGSSPSDDLDPAGSAGSVHSGARVDGAADG